MLRPLLISLTALTLCSAANAAPPSPLASTTYAIANPLRPGSKAPSCEAQKETVDGCTLHSVAGETYTARLSSRSGETWVASASDADTVQIQNIAQRERSDDASYQLIKIAPNPERNADATVTFDKLTGEPGALKVIERRRINVMIHPS